MRYSVRDIIRDVRVAIDENERAEQLLRDPSQETLDLDMLIKSKIEEASRRVELAAPLFMLEEGHQLREAIKWEPLPSHGAGKDWAFGRVLLPDDFMRLTAFRMSDWERTVHEAIGAEDPLYQRQSSRYKGVRGNPQAPVVAIVSRPAGKTLEFYSCRSEEAYMTIGNYLPYPEIDEDGTIDICERCYTDVINATAGLIQIGNRK